MTLKMGQEIYTPNTEYMTKKENNCEPLFSPITNEGEGYYKDWVIYLNDNESFAENVSYFLKLKIPKSTIFNNFFRIKLMNDLSYDDNGKLKLKNPLDSINNYQNIKFISVKQATSNGNFSRVILFPIDQYGKPTDKDGQKGVIVKIAQDYPSDASTRESNTVYFIEEEQKYLWYKSDTGWGNNDNEIEILNKNDVILEHTWENQQVDTVYDDFNFIFTPRNMAYKYIVIQMVRETKDQDIYHDDDSAFFGRDINFTDENKPILYELIPICKDKAIKSIGVNSHPEFTFAINGEEIKVGHTGYYELNNFDITKLAVVAETDKDNFVIDYQYEG